ncbi:MAG TPA: ComEC/Rec2 family competence protein [Candidatus Limnocylindria bacterium]
MRIVLAAPLLPAALAATLVAFALAADAAFGAALGVVCSVAFLVLATASVGMRRLVWAAAAASALAVVAHAGIPVALVPPGLFALDVPRELLARPLRTLVPSPESAVLAGIVLGERADVPVELSRAFAASGTTHLLAISGFNMTLVATAVALALRGRTGQVTRASVAVVAVAAYSVLVGLSPSVLRAALMSGVAACGVVTGRRAATANALCAAVALMLIADPSSVNDVGLQLSALATAGLVLFQAPLASRLTVLPRPIGDGVATTVAATAMTLPVIAGVFGRVSLISVLANLVCVPLFPLLMLAGAATSIVGAFSIDAALPVALVAWAGAFALDLAVVTFASLPLASLAVPSGPAAGAFVAAVEIAAVCAARRLPRVAIPRLRWRDMSARAPSLIGRRPGRSSLALAAVLAVVPAAIAAAVPIAPAVRVVALDIGQGDAYLVEVGGARALIDGGPDGSRVVEELAATLPPWERRIDIVALTHAHTDHGAGLLSVLQRYQVGLAIEPEGLNASPLSDLWAAAIAKNGAERRAVHTGDRITLGDATISVLAPDPDLRVDVPSLVLRVERGSFSALFMGDAVDDALVRLLEHPERLRARVYVPPHHGAATPYAVAMRDAAHPEAALISVGAGNRYGHPTPETLAALRGVPTYRTDQDGTVEIALDGTGLVVRTHANGLPPPRRGPLPYTPSNG